MNIQQFSERVRIGIELGGGACIAVGVTLLFLLGAFTTLELFTYDWRFHLRGERKPLDDILIITIDEQSERQLQQRMPWKRSIHADMLRTLMKHHPKLIVYDVIFQSGTDAEQDNAFADALYDAYDEQRALGRVVLAQYISPERLEPPLTMFADNAGGIGFINLHVDQDNIIRSVPTVTRTVQGKAIQHHLSLSLETAALYQGGVNSIDFPDEDTTILSKTENGAKRSILKVIAPEGRLYINYIGGRYSYPMLSFWKILSGEFQLEDIEGKVIFIGDTSLTAHDYFLTPFQKPGQKFVEKLQEETLEGGTLTNVSTFGIEIHAQAFQTILENSSIRRIAAIWTVLLVLCVGTFSGILLFKDRGFLVNILIVVLSGGIVWGVGHYLFSAHHLWLDMAPLEITIIINFVAGLAFQRAVALYNRNKVKGAFQQYVSVAVVDEMLRHPEKLQLGGERKFLTVLFSDIRGFTSISEKMESQDLVEFLNEYLTEMTEIVLKYDGTLDKYMGDAIMAIYGAPVEQEDHPARACTSALEMIARLRQLQSVWQAQGKPPIDIGIGLNSGLMTVGNMGSEKRFDYTVMGDNVNLGSRLEGINKQYGTNIILSEYTDALVKEHFISRELDLVRVKGKEEPVRIYELVGQTGQVDVSTIQGMKYFEQGLEAYRDMRWKDAIERFNQALSLYQKDAAAQLYINRCMTYQKTPPPEGWDGVYTMKTK